MLLLYVLWIPQQENAAEGAAGCRKWRRYCHRASSHNLGAYLEHAGRSNAGRSKVAENYPRNWIIPFHETSSAQNDSADDAADDGGDAVGNVAGVGSPMAPFVALETRVSGMHDEAAFCQAFALSVALVAAADV